MDLCLMSLASKRWEKGEEFQEVFALEEMVVRFYTFYFVACNSCAIDSGFDRACWSHASHAWVSVNQVELSVGCVAEGTGQDRPSAWSTDSVRVTSDRWWRAGADPSYTLPTHGGGLRDDKVLLNNLTAAEIVRISHLCIFVKIVTFGL